MNSHGDPLSQAFLEGALRQRIARAGYDLAPDADLTAFAETLRLPAGSPLAFLVLRSFELATYLRTTLAFLDAQPKERLQAWDQAFTRTVFLVGRPEQLADAFTFDQVSDDRSMAWLLSVDNKQQTRLLRLLQRLKTSGPPSLPGTLSRSPEPGAQAAGRRLHGFLATAGLALEGYLVHLNHLVCESYIAGALRPGDHLCLTHLGRIETLKAPPSTLRIHRDPEATETLKLYGYLGVEGRANAG